MASSGGVFGDITPGMASADLSTKTYLAVKNGSSGIAVCGAGERALGVLQNKPQTGEACSVRVIGSTKLVVDGTVAIAIGDLLSPDSAGRGAKTSTDGAEVFAQANEASTAAGDIIEVFILNRQR